MRILEMKEVIKACLVANIPLMIWGERGVGKSDSVFQLSQELKMGFRDLRLATQEVSDLIGMPVRANKVTNWLQPEWFPTEGEGILFLDEANRAPRDVIQAVFQLVRDRRMHTHELPPGWRIISAGNYMRGYNVRELDEAFLSRFLHINVDVNTEDLCDHGREQGWREHTLNFLKTYPVMVLKAVSESEVYESKPDPRRWEMVDKLVATSMLEGELLQAALSGLVGFGAAKAYIDFAGAGFSFKDILSGKIEVKDLKEKDYRKLAMEATPHLVEARFAAKAAKNLSVFIKALPKDLGTMVTKGILSQASGSQWAKHLRDDKEILEYFKFLFGASPDAKGDSNG